MLVKEGLKIFSYNPMAWRLVQPLDRADEIYDVVIERRNGEAADLLG